MKKVNQIFSEIKKKLGAGSIILIDQIEIDTPVLIEKIKLLDDKINDQNKVLVDYTKNQIAGNVQECKDLFREINQLHFSIENLRGNIKVDTYSIYVSLAELISNLKDQEITGFENLRSMYQIDTQIDFNLISK